MLEHHSNIVPWHFLRERNGAVLKWVNIDKNGFIDIDHLVSLITSKTKMIALTHMSNVLGTVQPIKNIVDISAEFASKSPLPPSEELFKDIYI